ncbi:MAG: haloacid dehalogenase [Thiotrichales bacterium]|nr:haloacid dehalogenase [Thiotrichales bacterium]
MTIKCVTLDLDDTLWDCAPVIEAAEATFYEWLSENYPDVADGHDVASLSLHRRDTYQHHPDMRHDFTYLRKRWLHRLGNEKGHGDRLVEPGFDVFWRARNAVTLYDGAIEALASLASNYQVGALTNGNADVHFIGIGHWFHFVVNAADAGALKPAPNMFHHALDQAGAKASESVHVGDDPVNDVQGAALVGMKTVWINPDRRPWSHEGPKPDAVVGSVRELDDVLARLGATT